MKNQESKIPHWFDEGRFGLFIHWGIYSLLAHENAEWVLFKSELDREEYNRLTDQFTAARFDADALAALARRAGIRYMIHTTRHHDGFCLFDTKTTDFNSVKTAAGRDLVAEYVDGCRRAGLRVGLYYSIMSWQQPAIYTGPGADPDGWERMVQETHNQVRELMTNYGKIDMLWYDGATVPGIQDRGIIARFWRSRELNSMVRELQPDILINDRSGLPEDFSTPEQHVKPPVPGRRWEACMTINKSWGYNIHDRNFKSPEEIIKSLIRCARFGGNLLMNIGPRADGTVQPECIERLETVGRWLERNGEAIYGSRRSPYTEADHVAGPITQKGRRVYVHLAGKPGDAIAVDGVGKVDDASILGDGAGLKVIAGLGAAVQISGFADSMFSGGPAVLVLTPTAGPERPARLLGGGDEPRILADNAPVRGDDPDRHGPPIVPVRISMALAGLLRNGGAHNASRGDTWCPGWDDWQVFSPADGNHLEVTLKAPVSGCYDLAVGLICEGTDSIALTLDGNPLEGAGPVHNPGCPDTWDFPALRLSEGSRCLSVQSDGRFGLYALRLSPALRPVPSDCWHTIGPFPTGFGMQKPVSEVRKAMDIVFPPEEEFDIDASCTGAGDREVTWSQSDLREGEHSEYGVNFPYRCGTEVSGVCYARTVIRSPKARKAVVMLGCDWWANLWVNGRLIQSPRDPEACDEDGAQFNTWKPMAVEVKLQKGENVLLVKCHPGSGANWFTLRISDPGDLKIGHDK